MTGKCDICGKIFNSHDGGSMCLKCGHTACPNCEIIDPTTNEALCSKCDKWKIEYPEDYQMGFIYGALEDDFKVTVSVETDVKHLNPRMRHAARIHGYRKGCAFVGKRPRNIQYKPNKKED